MNWQKLTVKYNKKTVVNESVCISRLINKLLKYRRIVLYEERYKRNAVIIAMFTITVNFSNFTGSFNFSL